MGAAELTWGRHGGRPKQWEGQTGTDVAVTLGVTGNQLVVAQPLPLDERMIALAAAISGGGHLQSLCLGS